MGLRKAKPSSGLPLNWVFLVISIILGMILESPLSEVIAEGAQKAVPNDAIFSVLLQIIAIGAFASGIFALLSKFIGRNVNAHW
jgi:hypothetical protein